MDPTVPPVLSLPGAAHAWIDGVGGVIFTPDASWLTLLGFHFTGSGVTATLMARITQSSDWGRSGLRPPLSASDYLLLSGLFVKPDRTSRSNVPWNGSSTTLAPTTSAPGLRFVCGRHPSHSRERTFLFTVPAWTSRPVSFLLSRDPAVCSGYAYDPCLRTLDIFPDVKGLLRMRQHPRVYRFSVRSKLTLSNSLTSWLSRQVLLPTIQAAVPLSRTALALHSSWVGNMTVSFSSVETLRRPLVCTLPLSAMASIHL